MCSESRRRVSVLFLICIALVSCTVKERRDACPCRLTLILGSVRSPPVAVLVSGEGFRRVFQADSVLVVEVPRTAALRLLAVSGASFSAGEDIPEGIVIPEGCDCPPLYLAAATVFTDRDTASVRLPLRKHFCTLSLQLEGPPGWGEPYWTEVRGGVNGVGVDGMPSAGPFSCRLDPGAAVRLPRQDPSAPLWLDVCLPDHVVRRFALGNILEGIGYDWGAPDLEDKEICLRLSVTALTLSSGGWDVVLPLNYVI